MDESPEVVVTPPRVTVGQLWNELQCYGWDRSVTISWSGLVIDHRDVIPVPHEHLCKEA
jgi:hypothetical protein